MGRLAGLYLSLVWAALLIPAFPAPASYAAVVVRLPLVPSRLSGAQDEQNRPLCAAV